MRRSIEATLAALLAVMTAGNGLVMLFAGPWWYGVVPGVTETGPFNPHFVKDIGAAYVVAGAGFAAFAWRPRSAWSALAAAAGFLVLHALIHIAEALAGPTGLHDLAQVFAGVIAPAIVALGLCAASIPAKEPAYA